MTVYKAISDLIGNTPLVELTHIEEKEGLDASVVAKVEFFNPAGSVKDRIAKKMMGRLFLKNRVYNDGEIENDYCDCNRRLMSVLDHSCHIVCMCKRCGSQD